MAKLEAAGCTCIPTAITINVPINPTRLPHRLPRPSQPARLYQRCGEPRTRRARMPPMIPAGRLMGRGITAPEQAWETARISKNGSNLLPRLTAQHNNTASHGADNDSSDHAEADEPSCESHSIPTSRPRILWPTSAERLPLTRGPGGAPVAAFRRRRDARDRRVQGRVRDHVAAYRPHQCLSTSLAPPQLKPASFLSTDSHRS